MKNIISMRPCKLFSIYDFKDNIICASYKNHHNGNKILSVAIEMDRIINFDYVDIQSILSSLYEFEFEIGDKNYQYDIDVSYDTVLEINYKISNKTMMEERLLGLLLWDKLCLNEEKNLFIKSQAIRVNTYLRKIPHMMLSKK